MPLYCALFEDGEQRLSQALLGFPKLVAGAAGTDWRMRLAGVAELLAIDPAVDVAVRLLVSGRRFQRQLILTSLTGDSAALEALAHTVLALDDGSQRLVAACADRDAFDAAMNALPSSCLRLAAQPLRWRDAEIIDDRRLLPSFDSLGAMAIARGHAVCWQGTYRVFRAGADDVRAVCRNALAIEHLQEAPPALRKSQHDLAARFDTAVLAIDECLWLDPAAVPGAEAVLSFAERDAPAGRSLPARALVAIGNSDREIARYALHPGLFKTPTPLELAAAVVASGDFAAALAFMPPASWNPDSLDNVVSVDTAQTYLKRIDARLERLERELARRQATADECADLRRAIGIGREDPSFALVKARQILERLVRRLHAIHRPNQGDKALLFDMIRDLTGQTGRPSVLPRRIGHYLDTIRVLGNLEAHGVAGAGAAQVSRDDVELSLMMTLNVLEWFLLEHAADAASP